MSNTKYLIELLNSKDANLRLNGFYEALETGGISLLNECIKNGGRRSLDLSDTDVTHIPDGLKVGYFLNIYGCYKLKSIGNNITIDYGLDVRNLPNIEAIGDNLRLAGWLWISNCPLLKSIGEGLQVRSNICIDNCDLLKSMPTKMIFGGNINKQ